jgi:hypothetical protein
MSTLINFNGQTVFKVGIDEDFTVPDSVTTDSPTDNANFDSIRGVAGGQLLCAFDDVAGDAVQFTGKIDQTRLFPGDVVAVGSLDAPEAEEVVITVTSRDGGVRSFTLVGIVAEAGVIGIYG